MAIALFWIVSVVIGIAILANIGNVIGSPKTEIRVVNAISIVINAIILAYIIFFSTPK